MDKQSINEIPQSFELDELIETLIVLDKIERGKQDVQNGNTVSHTEAKKRLRKWLK